MSSVGTTQEPKVMTDFVTDLDVRRERFSTPTSKASVERLRARGKLLARERIDLLCDPGTFFEVGQLTHEPGIVDREVTEPVAPSDGAVTGIGEIDGIRVCIAADDATVFGGARGAIADRKINRLRRMAAKGGMPFIALQEGSAGRIQETVGAVAAGVGDSLKFHHDLKGQVPTVAAIMGHCFGGPAFFAAMSDFVPMVDGTSYIAMSGPPVIRAGTGQDVSVEEIGGSALHGKRTGLVDLVARDEVECLNSIRRYLSFACRPEIPPSDAADRPTPELEEIVPVNFRQAYDMRSVLAAVLDDGDFFEMKRDFGQNLLTAFGRIEGRTVGVVASQPLHRAGMIEQSTARKAIAFIELCERMAIPLVFVQDVPGFHVGKEVEENGQVRDATDLICAVMSATVPKVTCILRKSYGLSYLALGGKDMGADFVFAWPTAEIGLMGPEAAARVMSGKGATPEEIAERTQVYRSQMSPYIAAGNGHIDDVIAPAETRRALASALRACTPQARTTT